MSDPRSDHIRTRFAPSPTGSLHIGGSRTALFNYLFARQHQGEFLLRIEDTDPERSKTEFEAEIIESLNWLDLNWDDFYRQSERNEIYSRYIKQLLAQDLAYISQEHTEEHSGRRPEVIRFRNPGTEITFTDLIRGPVTFDTAELGDFVIARSENEPLYHLTVVIDDQEMQISHVIRAEEHISNTPRQILLQRALNCDQPQYAHLPLILAPDRSKLSKRHGAVSTLEFRDQGYLPEALLNYLALLGWNPGTDEEIFHLQELIDLFDLDQVQKGGAVFDQTKLQWINKNHLAHYPDRHHIQSMLDRIRTSQHLGEQNLEWSEEFTLKVWHNIVQDRISFYGEITDLAEAGELDYLVWPPDYQTEQLLWKNAAKAETTKHLETVLEKLQSIPDNDYNVESIKSAIWDYASQEGRGNVLWPMRLALCGLEKSPDPFTLADTLGQEESIKRIKYAIDKLLNS